VSTAHALLALSDDDPRRERLAETVLYCSERNLLDADVAQATLKWIRLDQTPLPDVSIPGGLKAADDLTRRREAAREILNIREHEQHTRSIAERIAARIDFAQAFLLLRAACCFGREFESLS
jgi:hypothetical protein